MDLRLLETTPFANVISFSGSLDIAGVQEIEMEFTRMTATDKSVIIDMSDVSFIASLGLRMLLSSAKRLDSGGFKMVLLNPQDSIASVLNIAGLDTIIPIVDDLDAALKKVQS
ncbi:STAS domain-containing protein [Lentisphaerota bacterium ZTH]|nr:STAS domain-containing protein [Lentisphaerota bacterium]WET05953.1 STAS domain-containing protein [Lentisphaerota bacterium ZTH]